MLAVQDHRLAPFVVTGADGKGEVEFTLLDNLTTYRIAAIAIDREIEAAREAAASRWPSRSWRCRPSRGSGWGTRWRPAWSSMPSGKIKEVEVTATASGPLKLQGDTSRKVALPEGKPREIRFRYVADGSARPCSASR